MNMKKKRITLVTCIVTGTCILAGSAFANYSTSNGYDVYKKALKNLIGMKNYTMNMSMTVSADGSEIEKMMFSEKYDSAAGKGSRVESNQHAGDTASEYKEIFRDGKRYTWYSSIEEQDNAWIEYPGYTGFGALAVEDEDKETVSKVTRFVELLTDAVVGDLKNNFVYISETENGGAKYSVELDAIQIPELIQAGISAVCSVNSANESDYAKNLDYSDIDYYLYHDTSLKSVKCDFEVDNEGRLINNVMSAEFETTDVNNGNHTMTMSMELNMSDYGITLPDSLPEGAKIRSIEEDGKYAVTEGEITAEAE